MSMRSTLLAGSALAIAFAGAAQAQNQPFKLGQMVAMSGPGAILGVAVSTGVNLAVKEINASGGILKRNVVVVVGDTKGDPTAAGAEARRLAFVDKVDAVVGPLISIETPPAASVFTEAKILQIGTTGADDPSPQTAPYFFSLGQNASLQAAGMVNHVIKQMKVKAPAIMGDSGGTSRDGIANLRKMLADNGITPVGVQEFTTNAEDVTPQLLSLRRANPDVLMLFSGVPQDVRRVITNLNEMNWDIKLVSGTPLTAYAPGLARAMPPGSFRNVMGEASDGATYCASDAVGSKAWSKFIVDLTASAPDVVPKMPVSPAAFTYSATYIMKAAIEAVGSTDAAKAAGWIEGNVGSVKNIITDTKLVASKTNHFLLAPESVVMVENPDQIRSDGLSKRAGC